MANHEGLDELFFELASESRLAILLELQKNDIKMPEIARKLKLTHTETFRQLQRLSEAILVEKKPDGTYAITQNGRLLLEFSHSFEFVLKFRKSLLTRDLWQIPYQFINRLGELSEANLSTDINEMINSAEDLVSGAKKFLWFMGKTPLRTLDSKTDQAMKNGVQVKLIIDEQGRKFFEGIPDTKDFEKRIVPTIPVIMVVSEKYAGINILSVDNRTDIMTLHGQDPKILKWAGDLFLYYWEMGKRIYTS